MSEHDEPKTALIRLLGEHEVEQGARLRRDLPSGAYYTVCSCGERIPFRDWSPETFYAHLADVLLAEGYTTSPAPEATETVEWEYGVAFWAAGHAPHRAAIVAAVNEATARTQVARMPNARVMRRPNRGPWVPVDRAADEHEEGP